MSEHEDELPGGTAAERLPDSRPHYRIAIGGAIDGIVLTPPDRRN